MKKILIVCVSIVLFYGIAYGQEQDEISVTIEQLPTTYFNVVESSLLFTVTEMDTGTQAQVIHVDLSYSGVGSLGIYGSAYHATASQEWFDFAMAGGIAIQPSGTNGFLGGVVPITNIAPISQSSILLGTIPSPTGGLISETMQVIFSNTTWLGLSLPAGQSNGGLQFLMILE